MFTALNPSILSICASIQNDAITIVLALWATRLCLAWDTEAPRRATSRAMLLGLITSLAILSKATAVFLVPSFVAFWWLTRRRAALQDILVFSSVVVALTGWWFARNYHLYGDLSAQKGLRDHGYTNAPGPTALWHPHELFHWLWVIKSYYWLPIQYYRDLFHAPYWLRLLIGGISLAAVAGWVLGWRRGIAKALDERSGALLAAEYVTCMALYVYTCAHITHFAPRTTFPTFIVYAMFVGIGLALLVARMGEGAFRGAAVGFLVVLMAANGYCLVRAHEIPVLPFHLFVQNPVAAMP
jgi:hypothetical protein